MKKSYIKLLIFNIILIIICIFNSFISSILSNFNMIILLIISLVFFKNLFGFEKDRHRYTKEIILNILIILLSVFFIYYLLGLFVGFARTNNYYTYEGIIKVILPVVSIIVLKEFLRYQMLSKSGDSRLLFYITCILFILFDITNHFNIQTYTSSYSIFIFFSSIILPSISRNIVGSYISKKSGYKPNMLWILTLDVYILLLPIIPNYGSYIWAIFNFLFPLLIGYNVYIFFEKKMNCIPLSNDNNKNYTIMPLFAAFLFILIYFTSGFFRYYSIAIGSGSMSPRINKGDVVIIDQNIEEEKLKINQIIAYQHEKKIVIHRISKIEENDNEIYYYTKGDANNSLDNYIVYEDMIKGVVKLRIPFIGIPTVWLSES